MNRGIEFHDSVIKDVIREGEDLLVTFSRVVVHETLGTPGVDAGICVSQMATLRFKGGMLSPETLLCPVCITDGELRLGDQLLDNMVPVHIDHVGPTQFSCNVYDSHAVFTLLRMTGAGVQIRMHGKPDYMDDFPGSTNPGTTN